MKCEEGSVLVDDLSPPLPSMRLGLPCGLRERSPSPSPRVPFVGEAGRAYALHNEYETLEVAGGKVSWLRSHGQPVQSGDQRRYLEMTARALRARLEVSISLPFSGGMCPVPFWGQCGLTFARKINQGGWMIRQGLASPENVTCKHARGHTSGTQILSQRCPLSPFLFFRAGMMSALLDSNTQTNSIWLKFKGDFFSQGPECLAEVKDRKSSLGTGSESLGGSQAASPSILFCVWSQMTCSFSVCICFILLSALGSPCFSIPVDNQGCVLNSVLSCHPGEPYVLSPNLTFLGLRTQLTRLAQAGSGVHLWSNQLCLEPRGDSNTDDKDGGNDQDDSDNSQHLLSAYLLHNFKCFMCIIPLLHATTCVVSAVIVSLTLQMRHRELKRYAQGHRTSVWPSWTWTPGD